MEVRTGQIRTKTGTSGTQQFAVLSDSRGGAAISGPLFDLGQFVDEEDAFALSLAAGLHDPSAGRVLTELFHKEIIISGEHERHRNKICTKHRVNGYRH